MSERYAWKTNVAYTWSIYVADSTQTAVTGLVNANFTKKLIKDGVNSAVTVTVTELDSVNQAGWYSVAYTPNATGYWLSAVSHATYSKLPWKDELQVVTRDMQDLAFPLVSGNGLDVDADGFVPFRGCRLAAVSDGAPTQSSFVTNLTDASDRTWLQHIVVFTSGALKGQAQQVAAYDGTLKKLTFNFNFAGTPSNGDAFVLVPAAFVAADGLTGWTSSFANVQTWRGTTPNTLIAGRVDTNAQVVADKTGYALTAAEENAIADALLSRDLANVEVAAPRHSPAAAFAKLSNRVALSPDGTTLTVYRSDGTTVQYTQTATTDANAKPVTGVGT